MVVWRSELRSATINNLPLKLVIPILPFTVIRFQGRVSKTVRNGESSRISGMTIA
jgi:hypothetical protein